jgi:hypothetical protein
MAEKYLLVPASWKNRTTNITQPPVQPVVEEFDRGGKFDTSDKDIADLIGLLPKRIGNKATILFSFVRHKVALDDNGRVLYEDGSRGSYVIDLIKFFASSPHIHTYRPADALKFAVWLNKIGTPQSALGRELSLRRNITPEKQSAKHGPKQRKRPPNFHWKAL